MKPTTRVLSDAFDEVLAERRVLSAVFVTFRYDPYFFEQEILPVLFDANLSHVSKVRTAHMQLVMRELPGQVVVFYDPAGLCVGGESPRLDVRSVPVRWPTGLFHPKNVFLLVEKEAESGPQRSLIVAAMSANLTKAGWWRNVEACHIEEIAEGEATSLRDPVAAYLKMLAGRAGSDEAKRGVKDVLDFLGRTEQRAQKTQDGRLFTQFYNSNEETFPDFLERMLGKLVDRPNLEVISPYFDAEECVPLDDLIRIFEPREVRVALHSDRKGDVPVSKELFKWIGDRVTWGKLPAEVTRGRDDDPRELHAKVYRFFEGSREYVFIGSVNFTTPGHQSKNLETGMLVEVRGHGRRDFWLETRSRPQFFAEKTAGEGAATDAGSALEVRFHWDTSVAEVRWAGKGQSGPLAVQDPGGVLLFELAGLADGDWQPIAADGAERLRAALHRSSFVRVVGEVSEPVTLLVQQEGMSHAPSLVGELSVPQILELWARADQNQKLALIEQRLLERCPELANDLVTVPERTRTCATFFDRFAGYFQAFNALEARVAKAQQANRRKDAVYALFSKQYDSLRAILERVTSAADQMDAVDQYVLLLTSQQTLGALEAQWPDVFEEHRKDAKELELLVARKAEVRTRLCSEDPTMEAFLGWFDKRFLKRVARAIEEVVS